MIATGMFQTAVDIHAFLRHHLLYYSDYFKLTSVKKNILKFLAFEFVHIICYIHENQQYSPSKIDNQSAKDGVAAQCMPLLLIYILPLKHGC